MPLANENLHILILKSYQKKTYANIWKIFLQVTQSIFNKNINAIKVSNNSA